MDANDLEFLRWLGILTAIVVCAVVAIDALIDRRDRHKLPDPQADPRDTISAWWRRNRT